MASTYVGWDFENVWAIEEGISYPYLRGLDKPDKVYNGRLDKVFIGEGTEESPYIIKNANQLLHVKDNLAAYYSLANDIDLGNREWEPIGTEEAPFIGGFNGNNYVISNLQISTSANSYEGFFGVTNNAVLKDIIFKDVTFTNQGDFEKGTGTKEDPYIITTVQQLKAIQQDLSAYYKLESNIDLNNDIWISIGSYETPFTGGLDGNGYTISNVVIEDERYVGFFSATYNATLKDIVIENEKVKGEKYVGGLVGSATGSEGSIQGCSIKNLCIKNANTVYSKEFYIGGIAGVTEGEITKCYVSGTIMGRNNVGGIVGQDNKAGTNISQCYAAVDIRGYDYVGGIMGGCNGPVKIEDSFVVGTIDSVQEAGGIIGDRATITNCYVAAQIYTGANYYGKTPLANERDSQITNSYFDKSVNYAGKNSEYGRTQSAMRQASTYVGWDFENIWAIDENMSYPYLKELERPEQVNARTCFEEGNGTKEEPYIIRTVEQLDAMREDVFAYYRLGNDIDLENKMWNSICSNYGKEFEGGLDGNCYTIRNIVIDQPDDRNVGFFGYTNNAILTDIVIENISVNGAYRVGGLVGTAAGDAGIIQRCTIKNATIVSDDMQAGGLVGLGAGTITSCYVTGSIKGYSAVGGLIGGASTYMSSGVNISKCYVNADVTAYSYYAGGILGEIDRGKGEIEDCYVLGSVNGQRVAGIVGGVDATVKITNCYVNAKLNGSKEVYGIADESNATIIDSFYNGK